MQRRTVVAGGVPDVSKAVVEMCRFPSFGEHDGWNDDRAR